MTWVCPTNGGLTQPIYEDIEPTRTGIQHTHTREMGPTEKFLKLMWWQTPCGFLWELHSIHWFISKTWFLEDLVANTAGFQHVENKQNVGFDHQTPEIEPQMWGKNQETSIDEDFVWRGWETSTGAPACLMSSLVAVASGAWRRSGSCLSRGERKNRGSKTQE